MAEFEFALVKGGPAPIQYGWKGVADPNELANATATNGFWGLGADWYYNWGSTGPWGNTQGAQAPGAAAGMAEAMTDPAFVPMIPCTDDADAARFISPQEAADLAQAHPGRVWLVFNEPDLSNDGDHCGTAINQRYPEENYFDGSNYDGLGAYLAQQYIRYYDAIKAADPVARLFAFGSFRLPGATGNTGVMAQQVWNTFASYLANPAAEPDPTPRPLDGIAIHAYPNYSAGCSMTDVTCWQQALVNTHDFFQSASVTAGKPIWITEIGNLEPGGSPPGSAQDRATKQSETASLLTEPLLTWFTTNAVPGGSVPYFNGLAWFSTHDCRRNPDGSIKDFTASDLLDIGPVDCPLTAQPAAPLLTVIGQQWAAATCMLCACPGPDCR